MSRSRSPSDACLCGHERHYHFYGKSCIADDCKCFQFRDELTDWANRAMAS